VVFSTSWEKCQQRRKMIIQEQMRKKNAKTAENSRKNSGFSREKHEKNVKKGGQ
jgi:hypothetical protein